ncbi:MAG: hypothetical protein KBS67_05580 [Bacteroidales bacterium]|nr:hypothetical protein [Candidatus Cryptobacteroides equifaecalis]
MEIPNDGTTASFTISANRDWTIQSTGDLKLSINPTSGSSGENINVTVKSSSPNTTSSAKTSTITITAGDALASVTCTQQAVSMKTVPEETLEIGNQQGNKAIIQISCNVDWTASVSALPEWISSISPVSGKGNGSIEVVANKNYNRVDNNKHVLRIQYASKNKSIVIHQAPAKNNPPTAPVILSPANGESNCSIAPKISWKESEDEDPGESIAYTAYYSTDNKEWTACRTVYDTDNVIPSESLATNTTYYCYVEANDGYEGGKISSQTISFTTGSKDVYSDGEYILYQESNKSNPFYLFVTGDGYLAEDNTIGGPFDQNSTQAIEALLDIEPYKTYKEYFTIYKIAAYSEERGISIESKGITKKTVFSSTWEGGNSTGVSGDDNKAFQYAMNIPEITEDVLKHSAIAIVINANVYAGTCVSYSDGRSVAYIPLQNNSQEFENTFRHEYGGHGIGRLADEYQYYYKAKQPDEYNQRLKVLQQWHKLGYYSNISEYGEIEKSPWKDLYGVPGYSYVGMYEGAFLFFDGFYRSEDISCMWDNRKYFNAISRWAIADRLMKNAGEESNIATFIEKDKYVPASVATKSPENGSKPMFNDHRLIIVK